jgi:hypothetical protein
MPVNAARLVAGAALTLLGLASGGCEGAREPLRYEFLLRVEADRGAPVPDARVDYMGSGIGQTGTDGTVRLGARGVEGDVVAFQIKCPAEFLSPTKPLSVVLHSMANPSRVPEYHVACPPLLREVVVAVRAENGPNLPLMYLGREIARTDESGAAHALLSVAPSEPVELVLDTNSASGQRLHPKNPALSFVVPPHDDVVLFDQRFTMDPDPKPRAAAALRPQGPIRITTPHAY